MTNTSWPKRLAALCLAPEALDNFLTQCGSPSGDPILQRRETEKVTHLSHKACKRHGQGHEG